MRGAVFVSVLLGLLLFIDISTGTPSVPHRNWKNLVCFSIAVTSN